MMNTPQTRQKAPKYILTEEIEAQLAKIIEVAKNLQVLEQKVDENLRKVETTLLEFTQRLERFEALERERRAEMKKIFESE